MIIYALFFLALTDGLFRFGGSEAKVVLSLMNVVLFIIPLVSVVFGTLYLYNAREFVQLLLSQPIGRRSLFTGLSLGLAIPLSVGFVAGVGAPFAVHTSGTLTGPFLILLLAGVALTFIFTSLAFWLSTINEDRARGFGVAILSWLIFAIIYDGIVLFVTYAFADYPLEKPMIALSLLNPIDLARILLLLEFDISALMGYTGAVFNRFFGSSVGMIASFSFLLIWATLPFVLGRRSFLRKDF